MKDPKIRKIWEQFINKNKEKFLSNDVVWNNNLNKCKQYIDENKKRPSQKNKNNDIKKLASWINTQQQSYKKEIEIMKDSNIRKLWENFIDKYEEHFLLNKKRWNEKEWNNNLNKCKQYIDENNKRPSTESKNKNIKQMGNWIGTNLNNYKKEKQIMKNPFIKKLWEQFIDVYKKHFIKSRSLK